MGYDGTLKFDTSIDSSGFENGISKIGKVASSALKTTTAIVGGAATAVVGIGTAAIKTGADFESSMSNVKAISGATGSEMTQLTNKAKEMGAKTKFSASESADAFSYMAMAGWKTTDMLDGIEGVMNLAAASGEDLATTSDIVTDALTAFGLSASDSTHFADVLASASSNANTNVGLMGETFKYVAPVAGALGFSAEDCATAIGLMANSGIKGSQAGTALRSVFSRMAKPTKEVQAAMDQLGVSLTDDQGNMKSLNEIMLDLREGFSGLTEDQKSNMAAALGGQEAMSGLLAIVNASDDDFNKLSSAINNCDGAAADMAETMNDNLEGQITILKSGLEGLGISLYEEMEQPMKDVVKVAQDMVLQLQNAFNDGGLDAVVDKFGDVMAQLVTKAAEAAPELIGTAENLVGSFINGIMDHSEELTSAGATMVSELVKSVLNIAGDMYSAGIYLFTEFLQALVDHSEEIGQSFGTMIGKIGEAVQTNLPLIIQAAKDFVAGFCQGLSDEFPGVSALIDGFFQGFLDTAGGLVQKIVDIISDLFDAINGADPKVMETVGRAIGAIAAAIVSLKVAQDIVGPMKSLFGIFKTFNGNVSTVVEAVKRGVEGFKLWQGGAGTLGEVIAVQFPKIGKLGSSLSGFASVAGKAFKSIGSVMSTAMGAIGQFFSTFGTTILGVGSIIAGIVLAVKSFVDMFQNGFSVVKEIIMGVGIALVAVGAIILGAPALITAVIAGIVLAVATLVIVIKEHWDQIVAFFQAIPDKAKEVIDAVIAWFQELPGRMAEWLNQAIEKVKEWATNLRDKAKEGAQNAVQAIVDFFTDLPHKMGVAIGTAIGVLTGFGIDAVKWAIENVPKIIDAIIQFFEELPGKVLEWLVNTLTNLAEWGENMRQKASDTANAVIEAIVNFFKELPGKVLTWLTNTLTNLKNWGLNMIAKGKEAAINTVNNIVNFFAQLPGKILTWLTNTLAKVASWGSSLRAKGAEAARWLVSAVVDGVKSLPSKMAEVGKNIVKGVWNGIKAMASWFTSQVKSFFSGIVEGIKKGLGIHSPSRVFANEIGKWIPPGVGVGIEDAMPDLERQTTAEMAALADKMNAAVSVETGKITLDKNTSQTYKVKQENGQSFDDSKTEVVIEGDTHVHVDLDGKEIGHATTPTVDRDLARIDSHKKRGG